MTENITYPHMQVVIIVIYEQEDIMLLHASHFS